MFNFKEFIKQGFIKAVGEMADYKIILNAAGWYEKGVFNDDDLTEIQMAIDAQYVVEEPLEDATVLNDEEGSTDVN